MSNLLSAPITQLGCVVSNLDEAIAGWVEIGVGPFLTMKRVGLSDYVYQGKPSIPKIDVTFGQNGDLQVELNQPVDGEPSSYRDFLAAGREGIHHLGWFVEDYEAAVQTME